MVAITDSRTANYSIQRTQKAELVICSVNTILSVTDSEVFALPATGGLRQK
jgi:hypothetical protein